MKFISVMKEFAAFIDARNYHEISYSTIARKLNETIMTDGAINCGIFEPHLVPKEQDIVADLSGCKGYKHIQINLQQKRAVDGFYMPAGFKEIPKDEIFTDWDSLINAFSDFFPVASAS